MTREATGVILAETWSRAAALASRFSGYTEAREDGAVARNGDGIGGSEETEYAHEHHGKAEDVEHVDAKEIGPRRVANGEGVLLNAEEQAEAENFCAAENGLLRDSAAVSSLFAEAFGDKGEGKSREKNEERRGKSAEKLRPYEDRRFARFRAKPGVVAMRLEHEDASEAAHPIDVSETFHRVQPDLRAEWNKWRGSLLPWRPQSGRRIQSM